MSLTPAFSVPSQFIELPSKGIPYPKESPLSKGVLEIRYPSTRQEDIMTNVNYARQGILLDELFKSLIITKINYDELLIGDKDAIMLGWKILGDGKDYIFNYSLPDSDKSVRVTKDLTELQPKPLSDKLKEGVMEYDFELPFSKNTITFKLLTHIDEKKIDQETKSLQILNKNDNKALETRLNHTIVAINGSREVGIIRQFITSGGLIKRDLKPFRDYIAELTPGYDFKFNYTTDEGEVLEGLSLPIGVEFFWPDL